MVQRCPGKDVAARPEKEISVEPGEPVFVYHYIINGTTELDS